VGLGALAGRAAPLHEPHAGLPASDILPVRSNHRASDTLPTSQRWREGGAAMHLNLRSSPQCSKALVTNASDQLGHLRVQGAVLALQQHFVQRSLQAVQPAVVALGLIVFIEEPMRALVLVHPVLQAVPSRSISHSVYAIFLARFKPACRLGPACSAKLT
jgi:hypothetical protein